MEYSVSLGEIIWRHADCPFRAHAFTRLEDLEEVFLQPCQIVPSFNAPASLLGNRVWYKLARSSFAWRNISSKSVTRSYSPSFMRKSEINSSKTGLERSQEEKIENQDPHKSAAFVQFSLSLYLIHNTACVLLNRLIESFLSETNTAHQRCVLT